MKKHRKQISKKLRFEVFKRDSFKCQYCGNSAPDVILHVDHIEPISKGGDNSILNLITSTEWRSIMMGVINGKS
jgi:5-methylcytosine-specific restriction endonuclease McrA